MPVPTFGPVEVYAFAFPTQRVPDGVKQAVAQVVASGSVTLLDAVVIRHPDEGNLEIIEVSNLGDEWDVTSLALSFPGLAGQEDLDDIASSLPVGTTAVVLVIEHTWSRGFVEAMNHAGGAVVAAERIPAPVVNEVARTVLETANSEGE